MGGVSNKNDFNLNYATLYLYMRCEHHRSKPAMMEMVRYLLLFFHLKVQLQPLCARCATNSYSTIKTSSMVELKYVKINQFY